VSNQHIAMLLFGFMLYILRNNGGISIFSWSKSEKQGLFRKKIAENWGKIAKMV